MGTIKTSSWSLGGGWDQCMFNITAAQRNFSLHTGIKLQNLNVTMNYFT